jgi:hypothetical protein
VSVEPRPVRSVVRSNLIGTDAPDQGAAESAASGQELFHTIVGHFDTPALDLKCPAECPAVLLEERFRQFDCVREQPRLAAIYCCLFYSPVKLAGNAGAHTIRSGECVINTADSIQGHETDDVTLVFGEENDRRGQRGFERLRVGN